MVKLQSKYMNNQKVWFTSDTHFNHGNIIRYSARPFNSTEEMDRVLIDNINNSVQANDILYHLGDFAWSRGLTAKEFINQAQSYRNSINCKTIHLITGNHDPRYSDGRVKKEFAEIFNSACELKNIRFMINDEKHSAMLCHYCMTVWDSSHYGRWHLYGHSHYTLADNPNSLSMDVGVDAAAAILSEVTQEDIKNKLTSNLKPENYRPLSAEEIANIMSTKNFNTIERSGQ